MLEFIEKLSSPLSSSAGTESAVVASVIWLHGLGADGYDFADIIPSLQLDPDTNIRFLFPHAPVMPVSINNGMVMPAWYDINGIGQMYRDDVAGIRKSCDLVNKLLELEHSRGLAYSRIILAGFSQGGAIALSAGVRFRKRLAGLIALSAYLPMCAALEKDKSEENQSVPILMMHGEQDPVVPMEFAHHSKVALVENNYQVDWIDYPMPHTVCADQLVEIGAWITQKLSVDVSK